MKNIAAVMFASLGLGIISNPAQAACESALVLSTYNSSTDYRSDWRMADLVDQATYEKIQHDMNGQGVVYGVPIVAKYSDWHDAAAKLRHDHNESLSTSKLVNIAWTGLDPQASSAYRDCLNSQVFLADGLHAAVIAATQSNIVILVKWFDPGHPAAAKVGWQPNELRGKSLRVTFPQGSTTISVARPIKQVALSGSCCGFATEAMILEPLPPKLKEPPPFGIVEKIKAGHIFTFTTLGTLPGGHIGTIYPY